MKKEIIDNLYKSLQEIGLTEYEQRLYVFSLTNGPCSVSELAKTIKISRPNVYKIIAGLEKYKLANFSKNKGYVKNFMVESPSVIAQLLEDKNKRVKDETVNFGNILPDIVAMHKQGTLPAKVKVIMRRDEILNIFEQVFDEAKDEILFFGSSYDLNIFISYNRVEKQIRKRIKRGVKTKMLVFRDKDTIDFKKRDISEMRETRFLEGFEFFNTSFYLFANKAVIWQPKTPAAVLIEDEYIVAMMASIYRVLWERAKE